MYSNLTSYWTILYDGQQWTLPVHATVNKYETSAYWTKRSSMALSCLPIGKHRRQLLLGKNVKTCNKLIISC
jgi:hypothetical protein